MKPISEDPDYADLIGQINSLAAAKGKVGARIAELDAQLRAGVPDAGDTHVNAALEFAKTGNVIITANVSAELREAHIILRQQDDALGKAMRDRQADLDALTRNLSHQAALQLKARHQALAQRYLDALHQIDAISEEENKLLNSMQMLGYDPHMTQYIVWPVIGRIAAGSEANIWHKCRELTSYVSS